MVKYGALNLGQIEAICNKLGGDRGVQDFLAGKLLVQRPSQVIGTFFTMKLGVEYKTSEDFCATFAARRNFTLTDEARQLILSSAFQVQQEESEIELVLPTVEQLGFTGKATRVGIYRRAHELGLEMVPPEAGPRLRLHADMGHLQAYIGMHPIYSPGGSSGLGDAPRIFFLKHSDLNGLILGAQVCQHEGFHQTNDFFLFKRASVAM